MSTQIEKYFQASLLADAAYVTFQAEGFLDGDDWDNPTTQSRLSLAAYNGTSASDDVPFGEIDNGRDWPKAQFQAFADRYSVVYHQPDQDNGFSATLFYDSVDDKYVTTFRGSNDLFPDIAPSDLLLALGLSSSSSEEQHSSISAFFQNAGLVDANGVALARYVGKVDFIGHSLGGYLSLWAMYEFRDLFAEVFTFNGAGISAIPGTPDHQYINALVQGNPLSPDQLNRIHNFFAEEGPELVSNDLTFFRPGERVGVFIERKDPIGTFAFHSMSLLVDSLAVYSLFSMIDQNVTLADVKDILYSMSNESVGSLDRTVQALSDMLGDGYEFSALDHTEDFRQAIIASLDGAESLGSSIELLLEKNADIIEVTANEDTDRGRGYRYALSTLLPFAVTAGSEGFVLEQETFDLQNFTDSFLSDRALFLTTLLRMNSRDVAHGDLALQAHFSDLEYGLAFNSDEMPSVDGEISDLRARLAFGSEGSDISTLLASSQSDRLYGMGGSDWLNGLAGSDYLEGGGGDDILVGGEGGDLLLGGEGMDVILGGIGDDYLEGGPGGDVFAWVAGDGDDVIGDHAAVGDRIIVNGIDLSTLGFERMSPDSPYFADSKNPDISLHYKGDILTITAGSGADRGSITVNQYTAASGADYGIVLREPVSVPAATDLAVTRLGSSGSETDPSAFWREQSGQGGNDWSEIALRFDAAVVANYSAGSLHGTLGGAFEGGPVGDHLTGDEGSNALHGLAGDDRLEGESGDDFLEGGAGSDRLYGGEGSDLIFGSARAGLAAGLSPASQQGLFYLAQISDAPGAINTLAGGGGDDSISGGEYTDYVDGGPGVNYLLGGTGADFINGGANRDIIYGDSALHYRYVEIAPGVASERLEIAFADGADAVGQYDDVVHAGAGDDTVWGELGDDELHGEDGADNLIGDRYYDTAYFAAELPAYVGTSPVLTSNLHGNDRLYGEAGNDLLLGLGGSDLLAGGTGEDTLVGGAGDDAYAFQAGDGLDYIVDTEGTHTLLFSGIARADLQVLFQGDEVLVGTGLGAGGFRLSASEWSNTRVALNTADAVIERSRLDTLYLDHAGNVLLSIAGSIAMTEAERDSLFTVDASNPDKPRIVVGPGADGVEVEALPTGGAGMRVVGGGIGALVLELSALQMASGLDFVELPDSVTLSQTGFAGEVWGSSGDDRIVGSAGPDTLRGEKGNDLLEGRDGNDTLEGGSGDDILRGEGGDDHLIGGSGADYLDGGKGNDDLEGGSGGETYRFALGDGQDTVKVDTYPSPERISEIRLGASVDLDSLSYSFANARATLSYGAGDQVTLIPDKIYGFRDNALTRFTLTSEADPDWIPLIRANVSGGYYYGTYGADHFVGGPYGAAILPGYGNDIIESGDGSDLIVLNDVYIGEQSAIGNKEIWGQKDNDTVYTPLHQGLTFHYDLGDGHDTIVYDWAFSRVHPYRFFVDTAENVAVFLPNGQDVLAFGEGITLADLRFIRLHDALSIRMADGSGSIQLDDFFHAYGLDEPAWTGDVLALLGSTSTAYPDSLLHPALLAALPSTPLAALRFADGSVVDMGLVLAVLLEVSEATLLGTEGDDVLEGTSGDDVIHALGGDDDITDFSGSNVILAGSGNDTILVASSSVLDAGPGDDRLSMYFGNYAIRFGPGSGCDFAYLSVPGATAVVELAAGITIDDLAFSLLDTEYGENPLLTLVATGDTLQLASTHYDSAAGTWESEPDSPAISLQFSDGSVVTGAEIYALAQGPGGETITGTDNADVLVGTAGNDTITGGAGNDTMDGAAGDDVFLIEGAWQGDDLIIGGEGFDTIRAGAGDDNIRLRELSVQSSVERIDGGSGVNAIYGTSARNTLDFSATELLNIATIEGGRGGDWITGSGGNDVIVGGVGSDVLSGGGGNDSYVFAMGDGRDAINNADPNPASTDALHLVDVDHEQVWLSRKYNNLAVNVAGSTERIMIRNWYSLEDARLDAIYAGDHVLLRAQVDQLVSAMAAFDVPEGVGVEISDYARLELEPVLSSVWQLAS